MGQSACFLNNYFLKALSYQNLIRKFDYRGVLKYYYELNN